MRKPIFIVASCVAVALVVGASTLGSPALDRPARIQITTRSVERNYVDRGAPGHSAGDLVIMRQLLFNRGITPKAIGRSDLVCTYTTRSQRQCMGTFTLPRGKIVVSGTMTYPQFGELAVIGGTRLYDNIRGSMTVTLIKRKPHRELLVFRLTV